MICYEMIYYDIKRDWKQAKLLRNMVEWMGSFEPVTAGTGVCCSPIE